MLNIKQVSHRVVRKPIFPSKTSYCICSSLLLKKLLNWFGGLVGSVSKQVMTRDIPQIKAKKSESYVNKLFEIVVEIG